MDYFPFGDNIFLATIIRLGFHTLVLLVCHAPTIIGVSSQSLGGLPNRITGPT